MIRLDGSKYGKMSQETAVESGLDGQLQRQPEAGAALDGDCFEKAAAVELEVAGGIVNGDAGEPGQSSSAIRPGTTRDTTMPKRKPVKSVSDRADYLSAAPE